ncbi:MAG: hypothetical protein LUE26_06450 [Alistipes sp.]|nr:hypothetical protein [Alistipes sp.]
MRSSALVRKTVSVNRKIFLFIGLSILFVAFVVRWANGPFLWFGILLGTAITFKVLFLVLTFREKEFKPSPGFYMILAGVAMILISMLFKGVFPAPVIQKILFYGAITLKVSGLGLMIFMSQRKSRPDNHITL